MSSNSQQAMRENVQEAAGQTQERKEGVMDQVSTVASQTASQASTILQQTGEQVKNMAQGAADAVKNTLGMNSAGSNPADAAADSNVAHRAADAAGGAANAAGGAANAASNNPRAGGH